jgi:NAD(P)-dependent dehydrogenase (short-subunit alcohol dehydrogenase family)
VVVIVTGASGGLGAALARGLAGECELVLGARRAEPLRALAEELGAVAVPGDVTVAEDRERLVAAAIERFGRLDGLVNNAAVSKVAPALREPLADFRAALETNLVAPFALSVLACEQMRATGGGAIVNIASSLALRSIDRTPHAAYVASKSGLAGLTRELASQWGRYGVRVNAVAPGFFPTEMNAGIHAEGDMPDWLRERVPLARAGLHEELVAAVRFLLTAAGGYVSGQVLPLDGGLTTR